MNLLLPRLLVRLVVLFTITACVNAPAKIDLMAADYGFDRSQVLGQGFQHIVYSRESELDFQTVHVYVEGDGRPWLNGRYIADDPTPLKPLALTLANRDAQNTIYLGRPCYLGLYGSPECDEQYWTSARYAPEVVDSMVVALQTILSERNSRQVVLIGYSGGGSLAMLMADKLLELGIQLTTVVTVAANLDTDGWTLSHGYLPLDNSLNPMLQNYSKHFKHLHFIGQNDKNVYLDSSAQFVRRHGGQRMVFANFDHSCCWLSQWPELLAKGLAQTQVPMQ
jgi:pimeloyl-ACP methyl ester carboxylesterase